MNKDPAIERMIAVNELTEILCRKPCDICKFYGQRSKCMPVYTAEKILDAGWRKASEVAEELMNTALSKIQITISAIKAQEENGNITEFNGGAKTALEILFKDLAELKKKYTEEGK